MYLYMYCMRDNKMVCKITFVENRDLMTIVY